MESLRVNHDPRCPRFLKAALCLPVDAGSRSLSIVNRVFLLSPNGCVFVPFPHISLFHVHEPYHKERTFFMRVQEQNKKKKRTAFFTQFLSNDWYGLFGALPSRRNRHLWLAADLECLFPNALISVICIWVQLFFFFSFLSSPNPFLSLHTPPNYIHNGLQSRYVSLLTHAHTHTYAHFHPVSHPLWARSTTGWKWTMMMMRSILTRMKRTRTRKRK